MKKIAPRFLAVLLFSFSGVFLSASLLTGQVKPLVFKGLPDNVNKIVSVSCVPCHTSDGGLMARSKLNFMEWAQYSPEKQKEKAEKIYSLVNGGAMPPKSARNDHPENVPTKEQADAIKTWSESFETIGK